MLDRSLARSAVALFVLASTAAAQVDLEWDQAPQAPSPFRFRVGAVTPDSAGGWYVTATQTQFSFGAETWLAVDELLLRYDAAGTLTGSQSLGAESGGFPFLVDATGGFWTVLSTAGNTTLRKFDAAAVEQLSIPIPATIGTVTAIGLAPNGDILAAGANSGFPASAGVGSWSPTGVQNSVVALPNPNYNGSASTVSATGVVALARTGGPNPGQIDVVRPDGSTAWSITTPSSLRVWDLSFTPTGELVAVGDEGNRGRVLEWTPAGVPAWSHTSAVVPSSFVAVSVAPDGRIAAAGASYSYLSAGSVALVASLGANGAHQWTSPWTFSATSSRHRFDRVLFDASGEIVAGGSASLNTPSLQGQLQSAPVIASYSRAGALSWQFVGASLHNQDICTALHESSTGSFVYSSTALYLATSFPIPDSGRVLSVRPQSIAYCFGDGSGAACPCANEATPGSGTGCLDSFGLGGRLVSSGIASLSADTLALQATEMPATSPALYFQGSVRVNGGAGAVLGDGLRCAGGSTIRLGTKPNSSGASQYPTGADPAIHVQGNVATSGVRFYQVIYRNNAAFCTSSTFNLTNGVEISWTP
jgi:hypothetical protein